MAYNTDLADKIRHALEHVPNATEKEMFGGICFLVNDKMCMGVIKDDMMCRLDPEIYDTVIEKTGCRPMDFSGRPMKGYVYVSEEGMLTNNDFQYWVQLSLDFNVKAKSSKKKQKKT